MGRLLALCGDRREACHAPPSPRVRRTLPRSRCRVLARRAGGRLPRRRPARPASGARRRLLRRVSARSGRQQRGGRPPRIAARGRRHRPPLDSCRRRRSREALLRGRRAARALPPPVRHTRARAFRRRKRLVLGRARRADGARPRGVSGERQPSSGRLSPRAHCTPDASWPANRPDLAARVVALVNQHRVELGLEPLAVSPTLTASAVWKARHMAQYEYLQHFDPAPPVSRPTSERELACGYEWSFGENIAYGYQSPESVVPAWLTSPGHKANIENPPWGATGVGAAADASGRPFFAQEFGEFADSGSAPPPGGGSPPP